jgi:1,4-dihydroxy-2-naphthoyl-CoA hydrolase
VATLDVTADHQQPYGLVHGGVYCSMIEAAASIGAAHWAINEGYAGAVGVSNSTDFLRSVRRGQLIVVAEPIHRGRRQQLWQASITEASNDKLVSRGQVRLHNLDDPEVVGGLAPRAT